MNYSKREAFIPENGDIKKNPTMEGLILRTDEAETEKLGERVSILTRNMVGKDVVQATVSQWVYNKCQ